MRKLGCAGWALVYLAIRWALGALGVLSVEIWEIPVLLLVVFCIWLVERGVPWLVRRVHKWWAQRARR